jgi:hypothetical protein
MPNRLILSAGFVLLVLGSTACALEAQTTPEGMFERTLAVGGPVTLDIRTGSGSIEIHSGPANSVRIVGRVRGGRRSWFDDDDVAERVRRIETAPPITQDGNAVRVGPVENDRLYQNISISYEVTVPTETVVRARSGSGDETITGLTGPVDASTGSGDLALRGIQSDVRASTGSGSMEIEDVGGFVGRTGSGNITARAVRGAIDAQSGSGDIQVTQSGEADVEVETGSGVIDVGGARRALRARAGSGSIAAGSGGVRIDFPEDSAFDLNVRTGSGSISTTHPLVQGGTSSRNRLRGTVRGGGARVNLSTGSGSVRIE